MNYRDLKEEILPRWEEILQSITEPAKKRGEYICPFCGHGKGGDGLRLNPKSSKYGLKCFGSCNFSGDILELIKKQYNLDTFPEQIEKASSILGINTEDYKPSSNSKFMDFDGYVGTDKTAKEVGQKQAKSEQDNNMSIHIDTYTHTHTDNKPEADYISYYEECSKRIGETDYLTSRGISEKTAKKYWIGFDDQSKPYGEGNSTRWKGLIIPTGKSSYIIRNTDINAPKDRRYGKVGEAKLFNIKALKEASSPIFITEGEIDALSILEVGGEAIGLGSTSNIDKLIEALKATKPAQALIIGLDNDKTGREASEDLSRKLSELKLPSYVINIYGEAKDANEALQRDRESLYREVLNIATTIREEKAKELEEERKKYLRSETVLGHLEDFRDGIKNSVNTPATPTGFNLIDDILDGGLYEGLYCIGAITSLGKTTLALQIADQIASQTKKRVLIYSLEMSEAELISKSLSRLTFSEALQSGKDTKLAKTSRGITDGDRYKSYNSEEEALINNAIQTYAREYARKITIKEGIGDIGVQQIREDVERVYRLFGEAPIVLVDYLQILAPYDKEYIRASDKQNTDKNVVELKRISRDYKTTVIGISSFNRDNYTAPVNLSSFKESGAIEYSSDVLIGLQFLGMDYQEGEADKGRDKRIRDLRREQEAKGRLGQAQTIQLKVLKNRYGCKGDIVLNFYPMFNYFREDIEASTEPIERTKL